MHRNQIRLGQTLLLAVSVGLVSRPALAGKPVGWYDAPRAVRDVVVSQGGLPNPLDLETEQNEGQAVYEAQITDQAGVVKDLVIRADGKLIATKADDAADKATERAARGKAVLKGVKFSHPTKINNPYLPLAELKQDIFEGTEGAEKVRVTRTVRPDLHKTFTIGDQKVEALVVEDRAYADGVLDEVAIDYFAQDDDGTVYYLGEEVDEYKDGRVVSHTGSWLLGKDTPVPGVMFPAQPKAGLKWRSEDVSSSIGELDEIMAVDETVVVPAGTYKNCIKVKESLADGTTEYKYYGKGVGVIREQPTGGDVKLISHTKIAR